MSAFAAATGIGMLIWGITAFSDMGGPSGLPAGHPGAGPGDGMFTGFIVLWVVVGLGIVGYHVMNSVGKAPPTEVVEVVEEVGRAPGGAPTSVEARLRALDDLYDKALVSPAEYERKRGEILGSF